MIPANGDYLAYIKPTGNSSWPTTVTRKVVAWDDSGRAMVLGERGLVPAEEIAGFEGVREAQNPIEPLPHSRFGDEDDDVIDANDNQLPMMHAQTITALLNYDWLIRNTRDGLTEVGLYFESDTVTVRDGGYAIQALCEEGFTPATRAEQPQKTEVVTLPANSRFRSTQ